MLAGILGENMCGMIFYVKQISFSTILTAEQLELYISLEFQNNKTLILLHACVGS